MSEPVYRIMVDGNKVDVQAPSAHDALLAVLNAKIRAWDLEQRLTTPPEGKSRRVTISIAIVKL